MKYDDWKLDTPDYLESEDSEQQLEDGLFEDDEDLDEDGDLSFLNDEEWSTLDDDDEGSEATHDT